MMVFVGFIYGGVGLGNHKKNTSYMDRKNILRALYALKTCFCRKKIMSRKLFSAAKREKKIRLHKKTSVLPQLQQ